MHDFTKEELQFFLKTIQPFLWLWQDDPLKLESKIQSMIDNHQCKHEPENFMLLSNPPQFICKKCGEFYQ